MLKVDKKYNLTTKIIERWKCSKVSDVLITNVFSKYTQSNAPQTFPDFAVFFLKPHSNSTFKPKTKTLSLHLISKHNP